MTNKILIVEDEAGMRDILRSRLTSVGYHCIEAEDGEEGFFKTFQERPDLIILDLQLPKTSGEEVCKAIKFSEDERVSGIPVIVVTAKTADVDRVVCRVLGANAYLTKPVDLEKLVQTIKEYLPS